LLGLTWKTGSWNTWEKSGEFEDISKIPFWEWEFPDLQIGNNLPPVVNVLPNKAPKVYLKQLLSALTGIFSS
jgi:hypothetical protein